MTSNNDNSSHPQRSAGAFYGRKKAKPLKRSQQRLFKELFPKLRLDIGNAAPKNLGVLFEPEVNTVVLEIGFGGGEHLIQRAAEQPQTGFIGCEPFINGMGKALSLIEEYGLNNIRLFDEDATWFLDWLPDDSIDLLYLLYPDPWPKKRHWKRRFANRDNLARFSRVLISGHEFRFASDIEHYVNWTLLHCQQNDSFEWQADRASDWKQPWAGWQSTRYEKKAFREGRTPAYLTFKNTKK